MITNFYAGKNGRLFIILQRLLLLVLLNNGMMQGGSAQCVSTTAQSGTTFTSINFAGSNFVFSNASKVSTSDNQYATANALALLFSGNTEYLKITGFNFSIPTTAVVCGVKMMMEARATGITLFATVNDNDIRLVKNGAVTGNNQAKAGDWPDTKTQITYGSSNSLWNAFLTPTDVNSSQFGIAISAKINGLAGVFPSVQIDYVSLTVYYSLSSSLPLRITNFNTAVHNNTVTNQWQVATLETDATIALQRSTDGAQWQTIANYQQLHTGPYEHNETLTMESPYYYRLQLHTASGTQYSKVNRIVHHQATTLKLYPNPADNFLIVEHSAPEPLQLYNSNGQNQVVSLYYGDGFAKLDVHALPKGLYWLKAGAVTQKFFKR